ncbi:ABC transporter ATP-binding protein [Gulosibacter molinativorax]|uniref:ABC transporter ATP-binding protein n=1 Tax=Gulosibacter molinativorax TaxID=256821 RepID=A0ABT7C612_9MICO|nr:ABC transporter ATP-binding protein [Gulosibacter molinativorax]MDJ1370631.1 ABC transporter ATP-binding protein [Gulosibacter molinativorax]QUY61955.1 High-affinity branched-chain amino acid transport protein (ABC superfamily, ATP-binding protein) [Gulosibacter molinativorax]
MLEISNLAVTYGGTLPALKDVSIRVPEKGAVSLLGSNGAGKTTLLRSVSNNLKRHSGKIVGGEIKFDGDILNKRDTPSIVGMGVVQVPEGRRIFGRLTVEENLRLGGLRQSRKSIEQTREHVYDLFPRLKERANQRGLLMSGGEQQMLAIGRALMAKPKLLMLDEPSLGLAPIIVEQVGDVIKKINAEGTAILLIEQNANMALGVTDYAYVLEGGRVSLEGETEDLRQTDEIKHLYLGHGGGDAAVDTTAINAVADKKLSPWKGAR